MTESHEHQRERISRGEPDLGNTGVEQNSLQGIQPGQGQRGIYGSHGNTI